jgi:hypothetical protein
MSRSQRHCPFLFYLGGDSQAEWKRSYNRRLRRAVRQILSCRPDEDDLVLPLVDDVANPYDSPRDGTGYRTPFRVDDVRWSSDPDVPPRLAHFKRTLMK